jgi:hypothetical protein
MPWAIDRGIDRLGMNCPGALLTTAAALLKVGDSSVGAKLPADAGAAPPMLLACCRRVGQALECAGVGKACCCTGLGYLAGSGVLKACARG